MHLRSLIAVRLHKGRSCYCRDLKHLTHRLTYQNIEILKTIDQF